MPRVHTSDILNDLKDLSSTANSLIQQHVSDSQHNLLDDWFALIKDAALKIVAASIDEKCDNSKELTFEIPSILEFIKPKTEVQKDETSVLHGDTSRAHIHRAKENVVSVGNFSTDAKQTKISKSTVDDIKINSAQNLPQDVATPEEKKLVQETNNFQAENTYTVTPEEKILVQETYCQAENTYTVTPEEKKSVQDTDNLQTPKRAERVSKRNLLKKENRKLQKSGLVENSSEFPKPPSNPQSPNSEHGPLCLENGEKEKVANGSMTLPNPDPKPHEHNHKRMEEEDGNSKGVKSCSVDMEEAELNLPAKGTKVLKEDVTNNCTTSVLTSHRRMVTRNANTAASLLASQKNAVQAVIQPPKSILNIQMKNSAQALAMKKEEEKLMEMKLKEEKANENLQKVLSLRQMKLEESKRKRQEKLDHALEKRQKLEQEKVLLLKKKNKCDLLINSSKVRKTTEKRKRQESADRSSEKRKPAKREKEDILSKNQQVYNNTPTELYGTKVVPKVENRSNEVAGKRSKQTPKCANETVVLQPKTPPSGPPKSALHENNMKTPTNTSKGELTSYEMTPIQDYYNNDDSFEETARDHSKKIPLWAQGIQLKTALINQHYNSINPDEIFGVVIDSPVLSKIFGQQKKHYLKRSSSALWQSNSFVKIV